jgi:hypothetical protein
LVTSSAKVKGGFDSFGSTVGASILFFVGGFIYTVIDSDSSLGDNDTAHAFALGMCKLCLHSISLYPNRRRGFPTRQTSIPLSRIKVMKGFHYVRIIDESPGWMVIPYLAIVACAMLAANSPSTLEGLVYDGANTAVPDKYEASFFSARIHEVTRTYRPLAALLRQLEGYNPVEMAFEGRFCTVKLWKRGLNKRQWVQEAVNDYEAAAVRRRFGKEGIAADELRESLTLDARDCSYVAVGSLFLVLVPSLLAFLMSYNTPRAGLSVS